MKQRLVTAYVLAATLTLALPTTALAQESQRFRAADAQEAATAQDCPEELQGAWQGRLPARQLFELRLAVHKSAGGALQAEIRSAAHTEAARVWLDGTHLRFQSSNAPIAFEGVFSGDSSRIDGFVRHASAITRVVLPLSAGSVPRTWEVTWSPLDVRDESVRLDLYVGDDGAGGIGGFWFFRDQRLPGLWGYGLTCRDSAISLGEKTLGLEFEGRFDRTEDALILQVKGPGGSLPVTFSRMPPELVPALPDAPEAPARQPDHAVYVERVPESANDGWPTSTPSAVGLDVDRIRDMVKAIAAGEMGLAHSVLIARHGELVVEEYFCGFDRTTWHDMRSASKSVASTLIGLAIQDGHITGVASTALSLLPRYRQYGNWDPRKARITVADLLNMSSGLDANDYDPNAAAAEGTYQSQTAQPDWVKLALDAPMVADPGATPFVYGGANPLILGGILAQVLDEPVQWFADRKLFAPLGIEDYKLLLDPTDVPYMGGGLRLRPRDMLKFGQLYLDDGVWRGHRILSEDWVRESWTPRGRLREFKADHAYGYLWWHFPYQVGDRTVEAIEARGNGGQYISVFPFLDLVVVITGGNFRNGKTRQPEEILQQLVLPAVLP